MPFHFVLFSFSDRSQKWDDVATNCQFHATGHKAIVLYYHVIMCQNA